MALTFSQLNEKLGKLKHFMILEIDPIPILENLNVFAKNIFWNKPRKPKLMKVPRWSKITNPGYNYKFYIINSTSETYS